MTEKYHGYEVVTFEEALRQMKLGATAERKRYVNPNGSIIIGSAIYWDDKQKELLYLGEDCGPNLFHEPEDWVIVTPPPETKVVFSEELGEESAKLHSSQNKNVYHNRMLALQYIKSADSLRSRIEDLEKMEIEDLKKAVLHLNDEIARLEHLNAARKNNQSNEENKINLYDLDP